MSPEEIIVEHARAFPPQRKRVRVPGRDTEKLFFTALKLFLLVLFMPFSLPLLAIPIWKSCGAEPPTWRAVWIAVGFMVIVIPLILLLSYVAVVR